MRPGLSWVPVGRLICSISSRRESSEPKISSSPPALPGAPPVGTASSSCIRRLPSTERRVFLGIWMGRGWITSPGGPWRRDRWRVGVKPRRCRTGRDTREAGRPPNSPGVPEGPGRPSLPWVPLGPAKGANDVMGGSRSQWGQLSTQAGSEGHPGGSTVLERQCPVQRGAGRPGPGSLTVAPLAPLGPAGPCEMRNKKETVTQGRSGHRNGEARPGVHRAVGLQGGMRGHGGRRTGKGEETLQCEDTRGKLRPVPVRLALPRKPGVRVSWGNRWYSQ